MRGLNFRIVLLLFVAALNGCSTVKIPNFKAHVTLPASGDGYFVTTVSQEEGRIPRAKWETMKKRGIVLLSEDWEILRYTLLKNCLSNNCKDAIGVFDKLFYSLDTAVGAAGGFK